MEILSYDETLEKVEEFIESSGVRKVCEEICKGRCCTECPKKVKEKCLTSKIRNLSCSTYICRNVIEKITIPDYKNMQIDMYERFIYNINKQMQKTNKNRLDYYFFPTKKEKELFKFPKELLYFPELQPIKGKLLKKITHKIKGYRMQTVYSV